MEGSRARSPSWGAFVWKRSKRKRKKREKERDYGAK